jgi:hypothetical protein
MRDAPETWERHIARLVDGELQGDAYRAAVAAIEEQPHLWRTLALAFLEAQALGGELKALRMETLSRPSETPLVRPVQPPRTTNSVAARWRICLAAAASFLIALPLGAYWFGTRAAAPSQPVIVQAPADSPGDADRFPPTPPADTNIAAEINGNPQPLGQLELIVDGDRAVDVPVYHIDSAGDWLAGEALSPAALATLKRTGHRVVHEQSVVPVGSQDGAQVFVPIDRYRITPVGRTIQ